MVRLLLALAAFLSTALSAPFNPFQNIDRRQTGCPPSHLIIARGSLESPGPGVLISMAEKIMATNPGTTFEAVVYPATIDNYNTSSADGTVAVSVMLTEFVQRCPQAKLALLGYSQVCSPSFSKRTRNIY
jgi:hypothetical protein